MDQEDYKSMFFVLSITGWIIILVTLPKALASYLFWISLIGILVFLGYKSWPEAKIWWWK